MEARLDKIAKFNCIRISDKIEKLSNYVMIQQYFNNYERLEKKKTVFVNTGL